MSFALQMVIATLLGVLTGLFFGDFCDLFSPYANAYIMILKVTAVPYLIVTIVHGVGQLQKDQAKLILKRGALFISCAWLINIVMIYFINFLFPITPDQKPTGYVSLETTHLNFAELLIPENIFYALSNNIVPAVVVFSLLLGIALMLLKSEKILMTSLEQIIAALTRITSWIARITPIGTFLIIANQVGTIDLSTFKQMGTYIVLYILGILFIVFWIVPRLVKVLTDIPVSKWLKELSPILVLAYTTSAVIVCLPYIIDLLKKATEAIDPSDNKAQNQIQGTVSVVFNLPLGSLFIIVFVFFLSKFYNIVLSFGDQIQLFFTTFLSSLGSVGLGGWINSLTFILDSLALPEAGLNLYLTTLPFTSGFQALVSATEVTSLAFLITLSCRGKLFYRPFKLIKQVAFFFIPLSLIYCSIKFTHILPVIKNEAKSIFDLNISSALPIEVLTKPPAPQPIEEDVFDHILTTKKLRVGYHLDIAPFCFYNTTEDVVGYDIAFAYELAYDLGCRLELVPFDYQNLQHDLTNHVYDIAMSAVSINEQRLKEIAFSHPYLNPRIVLITPEKYRHKFIKIEKIRKNRALKIAALKGSAFEILAKEHFPNNPLILINSYEEFALEKEEPVALLWEEQESIAWTLIHRNHRVILPDISLGLDTLAYAIAPNNPRFLSYLNQWLALKKAEGFTDRQYNLWVKGKTEIAIPQEPRWSILNYIKKRY